MLSIAVSTAWADGTGKPRIDELEIDRHGNTLRVSFVVSRGLSDDAIERIHSGVTVTYQHRIEVLARRVVPLWPARLVARLRVETEASYDAITRRYELTRRLWVGTEQRGVDHDSTESLEAVRTWMTELDELPELTLPDSPRLKLRIESALGRRYVLLVFPARVLASAERKLS